jgi:hypothetical protein
MRWLGAIVSVIGGLKDEEMKMLLDVDVGVMIGRREICGLGTLGVTASLASVGNRNSFARARQDQCDSECCG